jgi:hypothetical protein
MPLGLPVRRSDPPQISTRQYTRLVQRWVGELGLNTFGFGTHSMRRKAVQIYRKNGNLRAVQLLLSHTKLSSVTPSLRAPPPDTLALKWTTL